MVLARSQVGSSAYRLLSTNAKRDVTINAEAYDRYSGARPEIIIQLPISQEPPLPNDVGGICPRSDCVLRSPPIMGGIGTIQTLRPGLTTLPSGCVPLQPI